MNTYFATPSMNMLATPLRKALAPRGSRGGGGSAKHGVERNKLAGYGEWIADRVERGDGVHARGIFRSLVDEIVHG